MALRNRFFTTSCKISTGLLADWWCFQNEQARACGLFITLQYHEFAPFRYLYICTSPEQSTKVGLTAGGPGVTFQIDKTLHAAQICALDRQVLRSAQGRLDFLSLKEDSHLPVDSGVHQLQDIFHPADMGDHLFFNDHEHRARAPEPVLYQSNGTGQLLRAELEEGSGVLTKRKLIIDDEFAGHTPSFDTGAS